MRAQAEFSAGAHHAIRNVIVGLACRDLEATRKLRAGKRDNNIVIQAKIASATNDALQFARAISLAYIHLAVANGLFKLSELFNLYDLANNQRPRALWNSGVSLGLKTYAHESGIHIGGGNAPTGVLSTEDAGNPVLGNKH